MIHCLRGVRRQLHCVSRCRIASASRDRNRPILASVSVWRLMLKARSVSRSSGTQYGVPAIVRPLRLTTGIILFAFATSHFIGHAFGVRSVDAMQAASIVLLKPWQTSVGLCILYGAFLVHAALG